MTRTRTPNPLHAVYDAMTEDEKIEHIQGHAALVESCVELFQKRTGYIVQLIPEGAWAESMMYTGRIRWIKSGFAVDRAFTVRDQMTQMERGLNALRLDYEHWELRGELAQLIEQHGVTDERKA